MWQSAARAGSGWEGARCIGLRKSILDLGGPLGTKVFATALCRILQA
jgi:hypothetical protein